MIKISGASDDLIEIEGDIVEEFNIWPDKPGEATLLACSDGTLLRIEFSLAGIWRITPVVHGLAKLTIEQAPEDDDNNYTDVATLSGVDVAWVMCGAAYAYARNMQPFAVPAEAPEAANEA